MRKLGYKGIGIATGVLLLCCIMTLSVLAGSGQWKQDGTGYWYVHTDGSYTRNGWEKINGSWYYFNNEGYCHMGWLQIGGNWYYLNEQGAMVTGEQQINGVWYRFEENDGAMLLGWQKVNGTWAYYSKAGERIENAGQESGSLKGIDVSYYQGEIDWTAVKNDGVQFAIIRAGHGDHKLDARYKENMEGATAVGIPVGVYFYSTARSETQAISDAQFVIDNLNGYTVSYPVVVDMEDRELQGDLSKEQITSITKAFCDEIRKAGYTPMLYCDEDWYKQKIDDSKLTDVEMWVARYGSSYDTDIARSIWQCGSTGRINGIKGRVDIDFGYKDYTQIITPRTAALETYTKTIGIWRQNSTGVWFEHLNGAWTANGWELIDGQWYWFNAGGYRTTGWQYINNIWYYFGEDGAMKTGWQYIGDKWYYMDASGAMVTGWLQLGNTWYRLSDSGAMITGWFWNGFNWYYMDASGAMVTGWLWDGFNWYYLNENGDMATGWIWVNNYWYYLNSSGVMAANTWIGNYYVTSWGGWVATR